VIPIAFHKIEVFTRKTGDENLAQTERFFDFHSRRAPDGSTAQTKIRWNKFGSLIDPIMEGTVIEPRFFDFAFRRDLFDKSPICRLCNNEIHALDDRTVDHIIPYSKGGKTRAENGQLAHRGCNARKNAQMPTSPA
jgi:5-methylcytosine-specific restriction endonuclease McrA